MIVYKATNIINGKIYIGYTTKTLSERIKSHLSKANCLTQKHYTQAFKLALRKYGVDNFLWEELAICDSKKQACFLEKKFIEEFNSITPNGYNMTFGGEGGIPNNFVKQKISASVKNFHKQNPGYITSCYLSKTTFEQRSLKCKKAAVTRKKNGNMPKPGFKLSEEAKKKMSITKREKNKHDWYNFKTKVYLSTSISDMSDLTGLSSGTFSHLKNHRLNITKCGWVYVPKKSFYVELKTSNRTQGK
jgi:group I intron endonuclease